MVAMANGGDGRLAQLFQEQKNVYGTLLDPANTQQAFVRSRARQIVLRFESDDDATADGNLSIGWRLGATRIDVKPDGRR